MINLEDKTTPIVLSAIGTGTGDGGVTKTELVTSPGQPNVIIKIVQPIFAIVIRFINIYLITLVGLVSAGLTSDVLPAQQFHDLVLTCAKLSFAGAGLGFLKDLVTVFGNLEKKYPLLTGSI